MTLRERPCANFFIKLNRRFSPTARRPRHPPPGPMARDSRQINEQSATVAFPARFGFDKQVLQIKPRFPEPSRKVAKENRETDRHFILEGEQHFRHRFFSE